MGIVVLTGVLTDLMREVGVRIELTVPPLDVVGALDRLQLFQNQLEKSDKMNIWPSYLVG